MYATYEEEKAQVYDKIKTNVQPLTRELFRADLMDQRLATSWNLKRGLAAELQLGEDYRHWIQVADLLGYAPKSDPVAVTVAVIQQFAEHVPDLTNAQAAVSTGTFLDRHGREANLSKYLLKQLHRGAVKDWIQTNSAFTCLEHLMTVLGEIRPLLGQHVCVTANPLDMLLATEFCSYTSCFSVTGGRFQTILSYLQTNFAAMVFMADKLEFPYWKTGRAWLFQLHPDQSILGRLYGTVRHLLPQIVQWLAPHRANLSIPDEIVYNIEYPAEQLEGAEYNQRITARWPVWFDTGVGYVRRGIGREKFPKLRFPKPLCLCCDRALEPMTNICNACVESHWRCIGECGQIFPIDRENPNLRRCAPCSEAARAAEEERRQRREQARAEGRLVEQNPTGGTDDAVMREWSARAREQMTSTATTFHVRSSSYTSAGVWHWADATWYGAGAGTGTRISGDNNSITVTYDTHGAVVRRSGYRPSACFDVPDEGTTRGA